MVSGVRTCSTSGSRVLRVDQQFFEVAVGDVVVAPVWHRIELNAM